jgi:oligopeptide transport system ATP-binding protein
MKELLSVQNLYVTFSSEGVLIPAVKGISFTLGKGETLGIVGESGSGKTAAIQAITGLTSATVRGEILFDGAPYKQELLGTKIGMIFQDPMTSLNPTMRIGHQIAEGMIYHKQATKEKAKERVLYLLTLLGIPEPNTRFYQYPHELSGGMRQRVSLGIALACNPDLLIADEPTTALDVTVQKQILDLLRKLQDQLQMGLILITHDLSVVSYACKRMIVMYQGEIVEEGKTQDLLSDPKHPYTKTLLASRLS